jgi:molybdopterin molybdotransferase
MSVLCGIYQEKPLMCLSGNPFAALAVFELLARPVLEHISAHTAWKRARKRSVMKAPFPKASGTRRFVRAFYDETGVALPFSAPAPGNPAAAHSNAALFSLIGCNCLVDIPAGSPPLKTGDEVEVVLI